MCETGVPGRGRCVDDCAGVLESYQGREKDPWGVNLNIFGD